MTPRIAILLAGLAAICASDAALAQNDATAQFPSLQTTTAEPLADDGVRLRYCAVLDGKPLCGMPLGEAWCRKNGFARFVAWRADGPTRVGCENDQARCAPVKVITCARAPIVSD